MELDILENQKREELSMIEVAHALLEKKGAKIEFSDLVNEIQTYLGKTDTDIREQLSQFYTDLNVDGSFISLGDNSWSLRSWYAIDEIDEELLSVEEDDEEGLPRKKKKKRVNAFINEGDDNAIDWNNDDAEDEDFDEEEDENNDTLSIDGEEDDEKEEVVAYDSELKEVAVEEDDEEVDLVVEEEIELVDDEIDPEEEDTESEEE